MIYIFLYITIYSRDKTDLDKIVTAEMVTLLLRLAELDCQKNEQQILSTNGNYYTFPSRFILIYFFLIFSVSVESAKVLCNLLYHSFKVRELVIEKNCLENLINRINKYTVNSSHEMKLFDIKMLFIITALNTSTRNTMKELNGDFCLLNILDELLEQHKSNVSMSFSIKVCLCHVLYI